MNEIDLIKKVNDEIEEIEYIIKNEKKINKKNKMIKNLKITKNISLLLMPYIIVPMISYGVLAGINHSPIILEDIKENQKTIKKIDTLGNYSEYNQYEKVTDTYNVIYFYGRWHQKNGMYERKIKKYTINSDKVINELINEDIDEVKELLNDENLLENNFITDINQEFIETKNDITNEEKESYIEIILYYENNE